MKKLAVQSYCFRGFPNNDEVARKVREIGLEAVEICRSHVDWGDPDSVREALEAYRKEGIEILSSGVNYLSDDEEAARTLWRLSQPPLHCC